MYYCIVFEGTDLVLDGQAIFHWTTVWFKLISLPLVVNLY